MSDSKFIVRLSSQYTRLFPRFSLAGVTKRLLESNHHLQRRKSIASVWEWKFMLIRSHLEIFISMTFGNSLTLLGVEGYGEKRKSFCTTLDIKNMSSWIAPRVFLLPLTLPLMNSSSKAPMNAKKLKWDSSTFCLRNFSCPSPEQAFLWLIQVPTSSYLQPTAPTLFRHCSHNFKKQMKLSWKSLFNLSRKSIPKWINFPSAAENLQFNCYFEYHNLQARNFFVERWFRGSEM